VTPISQTNNSHITFLVGSSLQPCTAPENPYSTSACQFLHALSKTLLASKIAKQHADIASFAFFCREANIGRLKKEYLATEGRVRRGLGTVFHIAPSNVPTNFAYSLATALLAGNASIVRVTQKAYPQVEILCQAIRDTLKLPEHEALRPMITVISYVRNDSITAEISSFSNGRIIWGGDATIKAIRAIPLSPRGVEVTFADRYSFSAIDSDALLRNLEQLDRLALDFYNDTYQMGQGACSSPHLVVWLGTQQAAAKEVFWSKLAEVAKKKFEMTPLDVVDKYSSLIDDILAYDMVTGYRNFDNYLYVVSLMSLPKQIHALRGKSGYFYEVELDSLDELAASIDEKVQTMTYFGIDKETLGNFFSRNRFLGIDRAVPIGRALDFSTFWDGFDLIKTLSRSIDII
jgi:hypothetical protein